MAFRGFDTFNGFEGGYGYRHDPIGADRLYRDAVKAASGPLFKNISLGLDATDRAALTDRWPSGALSRVLTSDALRADIQKGLPAAHTDLASAALKAARGLPAIGYPDVAKAGMISDMAKAANMIPDVAKVGHVPTAMQEVMRAEAEIKEASASARDQLIAKAGSLSAAFGRYAGTDRLMAAAYGSSGTVQNLLDADVFARAGLFGRAADEQLSGIGALSKASLGLYEIPPHDLSGFGALMKEFTTYGPVVVTPEGPAPDRPDYTPSLMAARIPDTTTSPAEDAPTLEDVWAEVFVLAQSLAQHHRTKAIVRRVGTDGWTIVINVVSAVAGGYIVYLITAP